MVAIVTGKGPGLEAGSGSVLGSSGLLGGAATGRSGEGVVLNAATGNLVITAVDEMLVGRGPDAAISRTYNSLGAWDGDNDDYWRAGVYRRVLGLTGGTGYGTSGSMVKRTDWDGSEVTYSWNAAYSDGTTTGFYVATDGAGAYDTLVRASGVWTWTDGDTQVTEQYDDANSGRIYALKDANGNTLSYSYNATTGLMEQITTADGGYTHLHYSGLQLQYLETHSTSPTATTTRVFYEYDGSDRLVKVVVNLDPTDNSKTTGTNYTTTYTYDGSSQRVAKIEQIDGTLIEFQYAQYGSDFRVSKITQTVASGVTRVTDIVYDTTNLTTTITAGGQVTRLDYDAANNLTKIVTPPVGASSAPLVTEFKYQADGDVAATRFGPGNTTVFVDGVVTADDYDTHGNRLFERDSAGNTIRRTFSPKNELLTETVYLVPDADASGSGQPSAPVTKRYAYDTHGNLRFVVDGEGRVTEYVYDVNGYGQQTASIAYGAHAYSLSGLSAGTSIALSSLISWTTGKTPTERTETTYNFRGAITEVNSYSKLLSTGAFDTSSERSRTLYVYSPHGELLSRQLEGSSATETFTYDGLARIKSSTDFNSITTNIAFNDSSGTTVVTLVNGLVQTSTYNLAGELIRYQESGSGVTTAITSYGYDNFGRLRFVTDPTTQSRYFFYDAAGRKVADIDGDGSVTEYRYDANSNLTSSTAYATKLSSTTLGTLISGGAPSSVTFESIRPTADTANDRWEWRVYDRAQRLVQTIDGAGATSVFAYDGASQLTSTTQRANPIDSTALAAMKAATLAPNTWPHADDASQWMLWNVTQTAAGQINGSNAFQITNTTTGTAGYTSVGSNYQAHAGDMVTFSFWVMGVASNVTQVTFLMRGGMSGIPSSDVNSVVLSGPGAVTQVSGGRWYVSGLSTTEPTLVTMTRAFTQTEMIQPSINAGSHAGGASFAGNAVIIANPTVTITPTQPVNLPSPDTINDRVSRAFYDAGGLLVGTLDAEGFLTEIVCDGAGRKIRTIGYSVAASSSDLANDSFATLKASITTGTSAHIYNQWIYDARGLLRATIDGEGTVTRFDYSPAGYLTQQVRGQVVTPTTSYTLATLPSVGSAILETTVWTRNLYGQALTEVGTLTGSTTTTTAYTYDTMRRLVSTVTQSGGTDPRTYNQRYDQRGRLIGELSGIGSVALAALGGTPSATDVNTVYRQYGWTYVYDDAGRLRSKTGPAGITSGAVGSTTLYYYNADDSLAFEVGATGDVAEYRYNAFNERADIIVYAGRIDATTLAGMTGGLVTSDVLTKMAAVDDAAYDSLVHNDFNVTGTVKQVTDPLGNVTTYAYNAFGELSTDTTALDNDGPSGAARAIQTDRRYDRRGLLKTVKVDVGDSAHKNILTTYGYDAFGRAVTLTNALSKNTTSTYDRKGRLTRTTDALGNQTNYSYDARDNLVAVTDALTNVTRFVYDKANRRIATVDALGALTTTSYDADGRVIATRAYKNLVSLSGLATEVAENNTTLTTALANTDSADHVTRYAYDKDGQLRFTVDGLGHAVEHAYDLAGNEIRTVAYNGTITPGSYSATDIASAVTSLASAAGTRVTRAVYDASNRLTYSIDAIGQVTWFAYDSKGHLIRQTEFAKTFETAGDQSMDALNTWRTTSPVTSLAASDRTTRAYYDRKGQLVYSVDALGYVTQSEYDKLGNVRKQTRFPTKITTLTLADDTALSAIGANLGTPTDRRITQFGYDSAGRLISTTDPENIVTTLVLDALGQVTSSTVADGSTDASGSSVTAYVYDDLGRVVKQTRAPGDAAESATWLFYDALGQNTATVDGDNYLSVRTYDALGQVTTQTRYATKITASFTSATAVTTLQSNAAGSTIATSATYDAFGRVTDATDGRGSIVTSTYDVIDQLTRQNQRMDETGDTPTADDRKTDYTYDSFGNVVKTVDPLLNPSFAYYDKLGRVMLQVDAGNSATAFTYTRGGQVETVKHYLTALTGTILETSLPTPTGAAATTTFGYDKRDLLTSTQDAEGFTEAYTIDGFGDRTRMVNKLGGITDYVYDKRGLLKTETVKNDTGTVTYFVNGYSYDGRGNRIQMVEAQGAAEARTTNYSYDKLDRLTGTSGDAVDIVRTDLTTATSIVPTTANVYDTRGNVIETIQAVDRATGGSTTIYAHNWFQYDGFNRKTGQVDATGTLTRFAYDAGGNLLSTRIYETQLTAAPTAATWAGSGSYRETTYSYDGSNRLLTTTVAGLRTGEWSGSAYVTASSAIGTLIEYDKAGNAVRQQDGRGNWTYSYYDKLGRAVAQVDAEKYLTVWERDAEGNVTRETRYADQIGTGETVATATMLATLIGYIATDSTKDRITEFTYDMNGRRVQEKRLNVAHTVVEASGAITGTVINASTASSTIDYTYNGLGQVLTKTEANLADIAVSTSAREAVGYTYDAIGRLTREAGQAFTDQNGSTVTPRTVYAYDGLNNLKSTRVQKGASAVDADDRITTYTYGAGGRLATVTDAAGYTRTYGYDLAGRTVRESYDRLKADGSTTVTEAQVTRYDLAGRVITQTNARYTGSAWVFTDGIGGTGNPYDAVRLSYNAFGEVTGRGLTAGPDATAAWQESFEYDAGGRLWKTNAGDGVLRFHLYDKTGRETLTLAQSGGTTAIAYSDAAALIATLNSAGDTSTGDAVTTLTVYDKRGQTISTREPDRQLSASSSGNTIIRSRAYNAFGEVLSETDARGYTTSFAYNTMGRMLSKVSPQVSVTDIHGAAANTSPTETYGYDLAGRLVAVRDANDNTTRRLLLAGTGHGDTEALVTKEFHPDTGVKQTRYDVFGDVRALINEVGSTETYEYDKLGRLITQYHAARAPGSPGNPGSTTVQLVDHYVYDQLGQRTVHWNSQFGAGIKEKTDYDAKGRVVSTIGYAGDTRTVSYAWDASITTNGLGTFGGWTQSTSITGAPQAMTEKVDYFGRKVDQIDYGNHNYDFTFDKAGQLTARSNGAGESIGFTYLNTGLVAGQTGTQGTAAYGYDASGNRTAESFTKSSVSYRNATASYDALNRMTAWSDTGLGGSTPASNAWEYDAVGNVRYFSASYRALDAQGNAAGSSSAQGYWYLYDKMNRFTLTKGVLTGSRGSGTIERGAEGSEIAYTLDGNRASALYGVTCYGSRWQYVNASGQQIVPENPGDGHWQQITFTFAGQRREDFVYSADGYLMASGRSDSYVDAGAEPASDWDTPPEPVYHYTPPSYSGATVANYTRDALGRVTWYKEYGVLDGSFERTGISYDDAGRELGETTVTIRKDAAGGVLQNYTTILANSYTGGLLTQQLQDTYKNTSDSALADTRQAYSYVWWDGALQDVIGNDNDNSGSIDWTTTYAYDSSGHVASAAIVDGRSRTVSYKTDQLGMIVERDEADALSGGDPRQLYYHFGGIQLGQVGNDGTGNMEYVASIKDRLVPLATSGGAFRGGGTAATPFADFEQSYTAINGTSTAGTASSYTVNGGETLALIAQSVWGDASLWYLIADANGLNGSEPLVAGQTLIIPNKVQSNRNSADTWRPYDPNQALGDASPTDAKPNKGNKCGVFGQILVTIVSVAVTALTGNPILGNIASQLFGMATGIQQGGFNFKALAITAITAGISKGLEGLKAFGEVVKGASPLTRIATNAGNAFVRGALANGLTQGIATVTRLQSKFDFAGVAVAGVVSAVGDAVGRAMPHTDKAFFAGTPNEVIRSVPTLANTIVSGMASSIAGATTRSLVTGTSFGDNILAVLPDVIGSTFGRLAASKIGGADPSGQWKGKDGRADPLEWLNHAINAPVDLIARATTELVTKPVQGIQSAQKRQVLDHAAYENLVEFKSGLKLASLSAKIAPSVEVGPVRSNLALQDVPDPHIVVRNGKRYLGPFEITDTLAPVFGKGTGLLEGLTINGNELGGVVLVQFDNSRNLELDKTRILSDLSLSNQYTSDTESTGAPKYSTNFKFVEDTLINRLLNWGSPVVTFRIVRSMTETQEPGSEAYYNKGYNVIVMTPSASRWAIIHEFFHNLGFNHSGYVQSIMFPGHVAENQKTNLMNSELKSIVEGYRAHYKNN